MARQELGPHSLQVGQAVAAMLDGVPAAVVGCSGGPDSLALTLGARWAARRTGTRVTAVIVDHQLQAVSGQVAARTLELLRNRGIDAQVCTVDASSGDGGPEAAARTARRRALAAVAGRSPVLLGHTLDDQAETVLLGLARGSGATSLAGIRPRAGQFWHPLLEVRRRDTRAACTEWAVTPWQDPQNEDPAFLRSRVRARTLPALEADLGPGVAQALARTATLLAGEDEVMAGLARCWLDQHGGRRAGSEPSVLPLPELAAAPIGLARRVVKSWLDVAGPEISFAHVEAVLGLLDAEGGSGVDLPGARVLRRGRTLVLVLQHTGDR
ncbi:tRNA lysidine(34) synthetase TilS [Acidipropionibacterium jensenii]|uniref:tRNA lysidine(34) synthetase TilS n=1 Tax=Acidipropionibacterium jensenii TaxID=1749 RepID=UPI00214CBC1A|nr:tRNA lysidine(34) synthetase TilS [Acidipropionibacterium jensenii]